METKDGRHFDVYPEGHPNEDDPVDPDDVAVDTRRGMGETRPRVEHQTLCGDKPKGDLPVSARSLKEALERAPTQEFHTGDVPVVVDNPVIPTSTPKQIPSVNPTMQFFITGRVKADTKDVPSSKRGRVQANTFLGIGIAPPPITSEIAPADSFFGDESSAVKIEPEPTEEDDTLAKRQAQLALMRTINFLDYLILKSPPEARDSLKERKANLVIPRHLPDDDAIYRMQYYGRSIGYYGPVLWFIPPLMTLDDLVAAGILSEAWWRREPNFPEGFKTLSPFNPPLDDKKYREPGYWVLSIPGIIPGTTAKTFAEQESILPDIARIFGLEVENGSIHPRHRMIMAVRGVVDVLYFCAIAQHSKEWLTDMTLTARTANTIKTYHKDSENPRKPHIVLPVESLHSVCRACVDFPVDRKLSISDIVDNRPSQGVGLIVFVIPKIYD